VSSEFTGITQKQFKFTLLYVSRVFRISESMVVRFVNGVG
jgi:hypothetical protein